MAEAVTIASPVLARQIDATLDGRPTDAGQVRRMALALARYGVRMRGRATPFGLFAGVASTRFGPRLSARWGEDHQLRTRADAAWVAQVIARLEACAELRRRLPVVMNNLAVVRGEHLVVAWAPHGSVGGSQTEVSVRLIPAVRAVMSLARSPLRVGDLIGKLAAEHPKAPADRLEALVGELVARGILIGSLRPLRPPATRSPIS
ncbi:lantibiotic dehydratase [Streptomyces sp. NPDC017964]|uniref:lantibiotic dehydratase n=1 Tax=Streptomyces sp. NPDC017964 TaxID=3365022 RepID=UPI003790C036